MDDRLTAQEVELVLGEDGKLWINVDGKCILRVRQPESVVLDRYGFDRKQIWPSKER